jgi:hypothetical protein
LHEAQGNEPLAPASALAEFDRDKLVESGGAKEESLGMPRRIRHEALWFLHQFLGLMELKLSSPMGMPIISKYF